jgi:hypothetical protein
LRNAGVPDWVKALLVGVLILGIVIGLFGFQWLNRNNSNTAPVEGLDLTGEHVWVGDAMAEAAIMALNYGKNIVTIRRISVCGLACSWGHVYFIKGDVGAFSSNLQPTKLSGTACEVALDDTNTSLSQASGEISLDPKEEIVIYMKNPGGITALNAPSQATITVFPYNDVYEKDALVTALIPDFSFTDTEQLTYTNYVWAANNAYINFTVRNTGSGDLSIQDVRVDGNTPTSLSPALTTPYPLAKGSSVTFRVTSTFSSGIQYEFTVITTKGNTFGPYIKTAP